MVVRKYGEEEGAWCFRILTGFDVGGRGFMIGLALGWGMSKG